MERAGKIWNHSDFKACLLKIEELEEDRIFCGHDRNHLLDVARIAYIENLERNLGIDKELIYAAALLHDIGRHLQYLKGIPHHEGGVQVAGPILKDCGFSEQETEKILEAISGHRDKNISKRADLSGLLYRADKKSRCCFSCKAEAECNWSKEKKNLLLIV